MAYQTTTLSEALVLLGNRLMDPSGVRWTDPEKTIYLQEALRSWNALTGFYRGRGGFTTVSGQAFYDLPTVLSSLRGYTFTDQRAIQEICYHLMEPIPTGSTWNGTSQFTLVQVVEAVQEARDKFLYQTGAVITPSTIGVNPVPSNGRIDLSENIANVRRVSWRTADGIRTVLFRDDEWSLATYARRSWGVQADIVPKAYSTGETPPLTLQIAPVPSATATVDLLTINRGAEIDPNVPAVLGVPDDWCWVVIFGALTVLLQRDGLASDPARAAYCQSRWLDGVKQAKAAAVSLDGLIGTSTATLGSVSDADYYSPQWQTNPAVPRRLLTAGQNLIGTWPIAGVPTTGGGYAVTLDVVRNAPLPSVGADYLEVGPELLEGILDYAQHLASFKEGPAALQAAQTLLDRFYALAGATIEIQWASSPNRMAATDQTKEDQQALAYATTNAGTIN